MFKVVDKETQLREYKVYKVENDSNGYPKFLIREDGQWIWKSAKYFITIEETEEWRRRQEKIKRLEQKCSDWVFSI